jgi:hypothetical protein
MATLDDLQARHSIWDVIDLNQLIDDITPEAEDHGGA